MAGVLVKKSVGGSKERGVIPQWQGPVVTGRMGAYLNGRGPCEEKYGVTESKKRFYHNGSGPWGVWERDLTSMAVVPMRIGME